MRSPRKPPEKSQRIYDKYSSIIPPQEVIENPSLSALCWGIQCGDGWYPIIEECLEALVASKVELMLFQIKEKFGGLRIQYQIAAKNEVDIDTISSIIRIAEEKSFHICEKCGEPGTLQRFNGWYATLCPECAAKRREKNKD